MAKNDFQANFNDAFRSMLEMPEVASGTGSLRFIRPDKKTIGTVALRSGKVEALEVTRHPNYILQRAAGSDELSQENKDQLLSKFRNAPDSKLVADYLRQYMMLPDQVITGYVKEHFLGVLDEMMTWSAVRTEWKAGAEDRVLTMPFVSPGKLLDLGARRADYLKRIADEYTIEVDQIDELKFQQIAEVESGDEDTLHILRLGSGEYGAEGVYRQLGIVPFNVNRELHELWLDEIVDLIYAGQYRLTRPAKPEPETVAAEATAVAAETEVAPELNPEVAEAHIAPVTSQPEEDVDIERWLAERESTQALDAPVETATDALPAAEEADATPVEKPAEQSDSTVEETDDVQLAVPGEDQLETPSSAPDDDDDDDDDDDVAGTVEPADLPEMELQPFVTPFDDDYHVQLLAEQNQEQPTTELEAPLEPAPDEVSPATAANIAVTSASVAAGTTTFLESINQMKQETQAAWNEVVTRDEEIEKTRALISQQQEYLNSLESDRDAWNTEFEAKRATYEATVALLREHLQ